MTVKELRQLLFNIEDQEAQIKIVTSERYGQVTTTRSPATNDGKLGRSDDPKGYISI